MFYGQMSQKWNILNNMGPIMCGVKQSQHFAVRTSYFACFAASGPGQLAIIEGTMNCALSQKTLKGNV